MLMHGELPAKAVVSLAVRHILAHYLKRLLLRLMQSAALHIECCRINHLVNSVTPIAV